MNIENISKIISYLIGIGLMITLFFVLKNKNALYQKKVFDFPTRNIIYAVIIYFLVMIVLVFFK
jgi:hypothetical protein